MREHGPWTADAVQEAIADCLRRLPHTGGLVARGPGQLETISGARAATVDFLALSAEVLGQRNPKRVLLMHFARCRITTDAQEGSFRWVVSELGFDITPKTARQWVQDAAADIARAINRQIGLGLCRDCPLVTGQRKRDTCSAHKARLFAFRKENS